MISGTTATLENLYFVNGNAAVAGGPNGGGGLYLLNAAPTLRTVSILDNTANQGGGLFDRGGAPVIERSRIYSNQAAPGGGLYNNSGALILRNNFIYSNTVSGNGGGFYNAAISTTVLHNTFYANQATSTGGGVYNAGSSSADVRSNIFAFNLTSNGGALYDAGNATFAYNDTWNNSLNQVVGAAESNNITTNPLFVEASSADFHLIPGSPAIDTADSTVILTDDIDLDPRPNNQGFDMGADEQAGCYASLASAPSVIYGSVQLAVWSASDTTPDTVQVAGTCQGAQGLALGGGSTLTQTVAVTKNVTLQGGWAWDPGSRRLVNFNANTRSTLDAVTLGRVLVITNSATVAVEYFNIIEGNAAPGGGLLAGGGIYNYNGNLTVRNSNLFSNTAVAGSGGAVYNAGGTLALQSASLFSNQAANGGAVYLTGGIQLLEKNGIYSNTALPAVARCTWLMARLRCRLMLFMKIQPPMELHSIIPVPAPARCKTI